MLHKKKRFSLFVFIVALFVVQGQARSSKGDAAFNLDWKFAKGSQTGAQSPTFNDASWQTVSVPHSASYDAPTHSAEQAYYTGDYWYRKSFTCPANTRKVFIHFGAIMQTASVYVNGTLVGMHDNSGYTGFFFDISNAVVRGSSTCVAVKCNVVQTNLDIPPGGGGSSAPDFELWSGMYRDVELLFKDSVFVPLRGQLITTPGTASSAAVRAVTMVRNDAAAAKSVTVALTLRNSSGASAATQTATQSIPASGAYKFDMSTPAIAPQLWSPTTPTLYSLQTLVSVDGAVVDSVVEPVGFRFFAWNSGKFSLNGNVTELKGVCMAQFMGWVLNAVPNSRFAKQVAMIKSMGINSIRCAHYPRADAFYRACDSVGMLVYVEVPTWGVNGGFAGNTAFWNRIYSCDSEMVYDGYNHPSIYAWGLFNEQNENLNTYFTNEMNIIHAIDPVAGSGRVCCVANYQAAATKFTGDIFADNYSTAFSGLNTEAYGNAMADNNEYGNWFRNYIRGGTMDVDPAGEAAQEVNCMQKNYWSTTDNMAGGHFWCFMDYSSGRNTVGREGVVDRLWLPKQAYFAFKKALTSAATDYWTTGTPTTIDLKADLTTLRADGSDISQIVATLRNASGACVQPSTGCAITFTASPTGSVRALYSGHSVTPDSGNPVTCGVEGGRAGVLLRTNRTASSITITASGCGLTAATVNLTSTAVSENFPTSVVYQEPASHAQGIEALKQLIMSYSGKNAIVNFPVGAEKTVRLLNCQGRTIAAAMLKDGNRIVVDRSAMENGIVYVAWNINGRKILSMVNGVR
jgi:hypothetical protein